MMYINICLIYHDLVVSQICSDEVEGQESGKTAAAKRQGTKKQ